MQIFDEVVIVVASGQGGQGEIVETGKGRWVDNFKYNGGGNQVGALRGVSQVQCSCRREQGAETTTTRAMCRASAAMGNPVGVAGAATKAMRSDDCKS